MPTLFISDLHLSPARPDITALFLRFLDAEARMADALYILGDLFDVWLGDDDNSAFAATIKAGLKQLVERGVPVYFMAGNRDFLLGQRFAEDTRVRLLPEGSCVSLYGTRTLLLHGDTLCTLDVGYQRFRKIIRAGVVTRILQWLPLGWRMRIANRLRGASRTHQVRTPAQLQPLDATHSAVQQAFAQHQVQHIIHGHTHQPALHLYGQGKRRWVMGDWYEQGSVLRVTPAHWQLETRPLSDA